MTKVVLVFVVNLYFIYLLNIYNTGLNATYIYKKVTNKSPKHYKYSGIKNRM